MGKARWNSLILSHNGSKDSLEEHFSFSAFPQDLWFIRYSFSNKIIKKKKKRKRENGLSIQIDI